MDMLGERELNLGPGGPWTQTSRPWTHGHYSRTQRPAHGQRSLHRHEAGSHPWAKRHRPRDRAVHTTTRQSTGRGGRRVSIVIPRPQRSQNWRGALLHVRHPAVQNGSCNIPMLPGDRGAHSSHGAETRVWANLQSLKVNCRSFGSSFEIVGSSATLHG